MIFKTTLTIYLNVKNYNQAKRIATRMIYQKFDEGNENIVDIKVKEIKNIDKPKKLWYTLFKRR